MQNTPAAGLPCGGRCREMEEISQNIQILPEDTLNQISRGPLVKFVQECEDIEKMSRVWHSLLKTFSTASIPSSHTTASCNTLSAFLDAALVSKCKGTGQLALSPETWLATFEAWMNRFDDAKPKPMKQVMNSLAKVLVKIRHETGSQLIDSYIVDATIPSIILGEPRSRLKASLSSLEILIRKNAISPLEFISIFESWLLKNSEKWTSFLQDDCKALSIDVSRLIEGASPDASNLDSKRMAAEILILGFLNQARNFEIASFSGDIMTAFFQKLKSSSNDLASSDKGLLSVWVAPVRHMVLQNLEILEPMSNYILQPMFIVDPSGFNYFIEKLPLKSLLVGDMGDATLAEFTLLFASLQVAKKIGLVHEDQYFAKASASKQEVGRALVLKSEVIGQFLFHRDFSIRIAALSLLTTAPSTTKPLSAAAIGAILKGLPSMHAESDSYSRGEILSFTRKLIIRLKMGGISKNQQYSIEHKPSANKNQEPKFSSSDSETQSCLKAYIDFLKSDLRPTASYPRHITALKTFVLILESGLDPRINIANVANVPKSEVDKMKWKFNMQIFDLTLLRLLVDLLLDSFEEVRATSLHILNLFPRDILLSGLLQPVNRDTPVRLTDALAKAEQLASNTSRADHADTVARLYHIIFNAAAQNSSSTTSQWWESKAGVVDALLGKLEEKLSLPGGLFNSSMRDAPLHGYVSALRYIVLTPNFYMLVSNQASATYSEWKSVHTRIVSLCDKIWHQVKPVLCIDSPEGHSDEPIEEFAIGPKDILSYSWRALRESSLLLHATISNATYGPKGESGLTSSDYEKIGTSSFTQLAELRHRGAFSTVSQTFATCCQRCGQSNDSTISSLPHRWYQEARKIIFETASKLTRRSAGLPALATGILLSKPGGPLFQQVMGELHEISRLPAEHDSSKQNIELPQVHAMNCLKDIFTNTKLGPHTEPYVTSALTLSAERIGSPIWALRNAGLMLFRALLTRMCRLMTGSVYGFGGSSGSEPGARISFQKYPGLLQLLSSLLTPSDGKRSAESGDNTIVTEQVFPALELIAEKIPSVSDEDDIMLRGLVREQFKSPVWGVREQAARVYASLLNRSDILKEIRDLLDVDRDTKAQDYLHGKALCIKYALRRFASVSLPFWNENVGEVSSTIQDIFGALFPVAQSPFVATTLIEILIDAVEKSIESGAEGEATHILNYAFDTHGFHDILDFILDSSHPSWQSMSTTRAGSLLRRVISWTSILRIFVSGKVDELVALFQTISALDSNAGRWLVEQAHDTFGGKEQYRTALLNLCSSIILGNYSSEVKSAAILSLASTLEILLDASSNTIIEIDLPWEALYKQIDSEQTWNRDMADAELRLQGCLLTVRATLNQWKCQETDLRRWATKLRFAMQEETEFTTRHAAVTSLASFARILRPPGSPPQTEDVFLEIYLILYDMLNDDDEELRDLAAPAASRVVSYSSVSPGKAVALAPLSAGGLLSEFIADSYRTSPLLCTRIARYITGQESRIGGSSDRAKLVPVPDLIREYRKESTILFEEEKQNLFIDEVYEVDVWSKRLLQFTEASYNEESIRRIAKWLSEGLSYMSTVTADEHGKDGLLGWASKPETFTLGVRVISLAAVLVSEQFAASSYLGEEQSILKEGLRSLLHHGKLASLHDEWLSRARNALEFS